MMFRSRRSPKTDLVPKTKRQTTLVKQRAEKIKPDARLLAALEPGFYYFLAYCLFAIAAGSLMREPEAA